MKWLRRGRQLGQAVKNVGRLRQILGVFAKNGFVDVVEKINLGRFLPPRLQELAESQAELSTAERLRRAFEELGPTFVKLGQLLSTRPDLMPEEFIVEFTKLQDGVQPLPFATVKSTVERELGRKIEEAYASFNEEALAAASIGQVHAATLHTGEKVVVKVQRPDIDRQIQQDVALLAFIANLLETYIPETRIVSPKTIVDEFFRTLSFELDFKVEANNTQKVAENLLTLPEVVVPKVYKSLSTSKILTLERFEGLRVNNIPALDAAGINRKQVVDLGARAFFKSVMIDGLFHGDLHGGNLFILPGNRLGIIDFGIVGRLSERSRDQLVNMITSLVTEDYENLCYQYAELGGAGPSIDFDGFTREVRNAIAPYLGLSISEVNTGKLLIEATKIAARYEIRVPGDWMLVFKAIVTIEGMGRTLDPEFDFLAIGKDLVKDLVKSQYSVQRLSRDAIWVTKDLITLAQVLPRQIRWLFRKLSANDFAFDVRAPQLDLVLKQMELGNRKTTGAILASGCFIAGSLALNHSAEPMVGEFPVSSVVLFAIGGLAVLRLALARK
jgi:ubiquinone biosynthesis protein